MNINSSRRIFEILSILNKNKKDKIWTKYWKKLDEIYDLIGSDGNTRVILRFLKEKQIIGKDNLRGYFYNIKKAQNFLRETIEAQCFKEHGMGDIFG